jgi:hypothetical protein
MAVAGEAGVDGDRRQVAARIGDAFERLTQPHFEQPGVQRLAAFGLEPAAEMERRAAERARDRIERQPLAGANQSQRSPAASSARRRYGSAAL